MCHRYLLTCCFVLCFFSFFPRQKLLKKGHDVTRGDPIDLRMHLQYLSFVDHVHRSSTQIVVESVIYYSIVTKEPDGFQVVCIIVDDDAGTICHALRLEEALASRLIETLERIVRGRLNTCMDSSDVCVY